MSTTLLPCPFCGSTEDVSFGISTSTLFDEVRTHHLVECGACGAMGNDEDDQELAARAWNRRAAPAANPVEGMDLGHGSEYEKRLRLAHIIEGLVSTNLHEGVNYDMRLEGQEIRMLLRALRSSPPGLEAAFRAGYDAGYDDGADRGQTFQSVKSREPDAAWEAYRPEAEEVAPKAWWIYPSQCAPGGSIGMAYQEKQGEGGILALEAKVGGDLEPLRETLRGPSAGEVEEAAEQMLAAINWATGCKGEFRDRKPGEGPFWWRTELCDRAGIKYDGNQYQHPALAPSTGTEEVAEGVREQVKAAMDNLEFWSREGKEHYSPLAAEMRGEARAKILSLLASSPHAAGSKDQGAPAGWRRLAANEKVEDGDRIAADDGEIRLASSVGSEAGWNPELVYIRKAAQAQGAPDNTDMPCHVDGCKKFGEHTAFGENFCFEHMPASYQAQGVAPAGPGLTCMTCKVGGLTMMDFAARGDHAGHDIGAPEGHPLATPSKGVAPAAPARDHAKILEMVLCSFPGKLSKKLRHAIVDKFVARATPGGGVEGGREWTIEGSGDEAIPFFTCGPWLDQGEIVKVREVATPNTQGGRDEG